MSSIPASSPAPGAFSQYTSIGDLITFLAIAPDPNNAGNYMLWDDSIPSDTVQMYVDQANQHVTALVGNITSDTNDNTLNLAQQLATIFCAYRFTEMMTLRWTITGMRTGLGSISIDRLAAMQAAITNMQKKFLEDINLLTQQLVGDVQVVDRTVSRPPVTYTQGPPAL